MRINIDHATNKAVLQDADDLKRLDATVIGGTGPTEIAGIKRRDGEHIWFGIDELEALAGQQLEQWHADFRKMIAYAESKGWVDDELNAVRVHTAPAA
jgi:hypothetical protein